MQVQNIGQDGIAGNFFGGLMELSRVEMVIGPKAVEKLNAARVAVIGLGGVGSYVAEALCRTGVGSFVIMDNDTVEASNINRQLPALTSTIGKFKADVMAARLRDINPLCRIRVIKDFYRPGDFENLFVDGFDFIADAIDSTESKADLLIEAYRHNVPVVSAMGTGNKLHPEMLEITDISKTSVCPLARSMRKKLRDAGIIEGITVVYSHEEPQRFIEGSVPGSLVFVPACAGMMMAAHIVQKIIAGQD